MIVKISIEMVGRYLSLMMGEWVDEKYISDSSDKFEECVLEMRKHIEKWGDEKYVQLAFAHLIESNEISIETWESLEWDMNYPLDDDEIKGIINNAYLILWSDKTPKDVIKGYQIEFIETGINVEEWCSIRDELNPSFNKES